MNCQEAVLRVIRRRYQVTPTGYQDRVHVLVHGAVSFGHARAELERILDREHAIWRAHGTYLLQPTS